MMNEARQPTTTHQDENKRGELKAMKGQGKANAVRRALGDIGNVVGAKDGQAELQNLEKKVSMLAVDKPAFRSFVGQAPNNNKDKDASEKAPTDTIADSKQLVSKDVCLAREKTLINGKTGRVAVAGRKGRTLTATLTARSEAACGGFKPEVLEEPVANIDAADINNQLAVVDYIEDIYSFYRRTEQVQSCVPNNYMTKQVQINEKMRAVLIDWLIEVHYKFKLMPETLFLTTNLIDRYLAIQPVEKKNLQLVGMTAMLVASKYEEIWAPEIKDFLIIADNAYERREILDMEKLMLNTLKFNLCIPTPYVFLVRFLKAASSDQKMNMLAFYFVELCLVDYGVMKFSSSMLAASAVYLAKCTIKPGGEARWNATLRRHSGYEDSELIECVSFMVSLHKKAGEGSVTVVHRKYSLPKFSSVALLSPPSIDVVTTTSVS